MSIDEQKTLKAEVYKEASRYMDNARETLKKAGQEGRWFNDAKYVRNAAGTAYSGVLLAVDAYLKLKGDPDAKPREKSIQWYQKGLGKHNKKLLRELNGVYQSLHLAGYYDGLLAVGNMSDGLDGADEIIAAIKP